MNNEFDIAIVGIVGRFPGACILEEFWQNLAGGVESIAIKEQLADKIEAFADEEAQQLVSCG